MVSIFTTILMIQYDSVGENILQHVHKYTNKCTKMIYTHHTTMYTLGDVKYIAES